MFAYLDRSFALDQQYNIITVSEIQIINCNLHDKQTGDASYRSWGSFLPANRGMKINCKQN